MDLPRILASLNADLDTFMALEKILAAEKETLIHNTLDEFVALQPNKEAMFQTLENNLTMRRTLGFDEKLFQQPNQLPVQFRNQAHEIWQAWSKKLRQVKFQHEVNAQLLQSSLNFIEKLQYLLEKPAQDMPLSNYDAQGQKKTTTNKHQFLTQA